MDKSLPGDQDLGKTFLIGQILTVLVDRLSLQERLWKRAHAAHICRTIAIKKRQDEFLASELSRRQCKIASFLACAVNGFWRTAAVIVSKEKAGVVLTNNLWQQEEPVVDKVESEAVPMDVDIPAVKEVLLFTQNNVKDHLYVGSRSIIFYCLHRGPRYC